MPKWNFVALCVQNGKTSFSKLNDRQKKHISRYEKALKVALNSKTANPIFSKYFVKESIGGVGAKNVSAGNIEYGFCQALHAEEFALAAFASHHGKKQVRNIILGIIAGKPGYIATPCGNCRDILLQNFEPNLEIVCGAPSGGRAIIARLSDYLYNNFSIANLLPAEEKLLHAEIETLIAEGSKIENDGYSPRDILSERRYYALIKTEKGNYYGACDLMCDYHPIYSLRDAIRQARRANDPYIRCVIIVSASISDQQPHVMYKDRQHLLELNVQSELISETKNNPLVYLVRRGSVNSYTIWKTTIKEWLPLAFSPEKFGADFLCIISHYFRNK